MLGHWSAFCLDCGAAQRWFEESEDEVPETCTCGGRMLRRCPACEAPFSSTFAVDCEECGARCASRSSSACASGETGAADGAVRVRPVSRRSADPADREPLPRHPARGRRHAGGAADRLRAPEEARDQGAHPLLRRRGRDAGALPHPGAERGSTPAARGTTSSTRTMGRSASSTTCSGSRSCARPGTCRMRPVEEIAGRPASARRRWRSCGARSTSSPTSAA